ncbi:carboxymuconolactone decarboxylase family protein [Actinophytocola xanthii]|uniref:Carboxymuconolactone decarboxylase-like domain-containing protein n=1 Tax=Actinophytocola xanthii TaxID=1912961 RepID=A0A1Q8CA73_9PSEU|nr:carboxymuconolactone decarboxylase family protein [Actinophytocola xanthii]OLF11277.1 hypothetical protein BU204_30590 [Actinophytocola xanthii]
MAGRVIRTALRSSLNQVRYVTPVHPRAAEGLTARVYRQLERRFGMLAPPVALHSPAPGALAAAWTVLSESLVVTTTVSRAAKEAVATGVSAANTCPYCVEVHTATLGGLVSGVAAEQGDLAALSRWARESTTRAGAAAGPRPFAQSDAPQLIGVAVAFQYLNRVVNVFLGESPLPPRVPRAARGRAAAFVGRVMRGPALRGGRAGEALALLPPADPPADLGWAAADPRIADAFARAVAAVDATDAVPPAVRELVVAEVRDWDGTPPGLSRSWVEDLVEVVPAPDRPAARLALLVAKASYQVDADLVAAYRAGHPADADLVELVSWAALTAARTSPHARVQFSC